MTIFQAPRSVSHSSAGQLPSEEDPWFQTLQLPEAERYPAGMELLRQDSRPRNVFYLEKGIVKFTRFESDKDETIVGLKTHGAFVGLGEAVLDHPSVCGAVTLTECQLRRIAANVFLNRLKQDPRAAWGILQMCSYELHRQFGRVAELAGLPARDRLIRLLLELMPLHTLEGQPVRIQVPVKRREIAQFIGVTPEHLSRLLKSMCDDGLLSVSNGWLMVPDMRRLRESPCGESFAARRATA